MISWGGVQDSSPLRARFFLHALESELTSMSGGLQHVDGRRYVLRRRGMVDPRELP